MPLRCAPLPGKAPAARVALGGDFAKRLVATPGVTRVVAVMGTVSGLQVFGAGAKDPEDPTRAVLVIEGSDPVALVALATTALADAELEKLGLGSPAGRSVYTLQFAVTR